MQDIADMQFSSGEMHLQTSKVRQRVSTIEILSEWEMKFSLKLHKKGIATQWLEN